MKKTFFIIAILLLQSVAFAQTGKMDKLQAFILKKYPKAEEVDVQEDDTGGYAADFYDGLDLKTAFFDSEGQWVQTSLEFSAEELPMPVNKTVKHKYPAAGYDRIVYIESPTELYYSIEISDGEDEMHQLKVGVKGNLISTERLVFSDAFEDEDWEE